MRNDEQLKKSAEALYYKIVADIHTSRQNPLDMFTSFKASKGAVIWNLTHGNYPYSANQFDYIMNNEFREITKEEILKLQ